MGYDLTGTQGVTPSTEREPKMLTPSGEAFVQRRDEILEGVLQRRAAHPIGAGGGDVLGDVMTVVTGRAPIVKTRRARAKAKKNEPKQPPKEYSDDYKGWADARLDKWGKTLKGTPMDAAEVGLEGAVLAALQDEDPLVGLFAGAGLQAGSNMVETAWEALDDIPIKPGATKTGVKLGVASAAMSYFIQAFKELTPGGRDRILESDEAGVKKAAWTMAAMAMFRAGGFGKPSDQQLRQLGLTVDTWMSMRRSTVLSLISEIENDDSGDIERVRAQLIEDSTYFGPTALRRLDRAMTNEDVSVKDTIESLMESDRKFRRKIISLRNKMPETLPSLRYEATREELQGLQQDAESYLREQL
jgi:hypothetical protein